MGRSLWLKSGPKFIHELALLDAKINIQATPYSCDNPFLPVD